MKILALIADRPDGHGNQCMLSSTLLSGLVGAFGSLNVIEPFDHGQYRFAPEFRVEWPVFLASTALYGKPEDRDVPLLGSSEDIALVNLRFLTDAISTGLVTEREHAWWCHVLSLNSIILYDGSDCPCDWSTEPWKPWLKEIPKLLVNRPRANSTPTHEREFVAHISVPLAHIWRMRSLLTTSAPWRTNSCVFAAWNDNSLGRRVLMEKLAIAGFPNAVLWWGSSEKYDIPGTQRPQPPPMYYATMEQAKIVIGCAGGNRDCLRQWECLALGRLLVTDHFGCEEFQHRQHVIYFNNPTDLIGQITWAMGHPEEAAAIAKAGNELFIARHTPEQQCVRMLRKAGLI